MVKRGVRGIYEVLWYGTGAGEVRSLVNRTLVAEYTPGLGWDVHGRLPDDVREYAQQMVGWVKGVSSVVPHHETFRQAKAQPKKSHAQIKREVNDILEAAPAPQRPYYDRDPVSEMVLNPRASAIMLTLRPTSLLVSQIAERIGDSGEEDRHASTEAMIKELIKYGLVTRRSSATQAYLTVDGIKWLENHGLKAEYEP